MQNDVKQADIARIIRVTSCEDCRFKDHMGAFGVVAYIPLCTQTGKTLPYTKVVSNNRIIARIVEGIPDYCPLEKDPTAERDALKERATELEELLPWAYNTLEEPMLLSDRVAALTARDPALDVLVEIALFEPYNNWVSIEPAGHQLIATKTDGSRYSMWPERWTKAPKATAAALREKGL